jgi:hypothetical protein
MKGGSADGTGKSVQPCKGTLEKPVPNGFNKEHRKERTYTIVTIVTIVK